MALETLVDEQGTDLAFKKREATGIRGGFGRRNPGDGPRAKAEHGETQPDR
jgi:hypothetical protein